MTRVNLDKGYFANYLPFFVYNFNRFIDNLLVFLKSVLAEMQTDETLIGLPFRSIKKEQIKCFFFFIRKVVNFFISPQKHMLWYSLEVPC